jgi:hypothetical protein
MNRLSASNSSDPNGLTTRKHRRLSKRERPNNPPLVSSRADYIRRVNISAYDLIDLCALEQTISTSANHLAYDDKLKE